MNPISPVIKIHLKHKLTWIGMPWIILLSSFFINLIIAFLIGDKAGFYTGGLVSIFIYMFVAGMVTLNQTFSFSLGLSVRRKDYFFGTLTVIVMASILSAIVLSLLSYLESSVTSGWGYNLHFFSLLHSFDANSFWQFWIFFVVLINTSLSGFVISGIFIRFGWPGMYIFFLIAAILLSVITFACTYFHWWSTLFHWVADHPNMLAFDLLILSLIYAVLSYLFLRKATV
ncbi:hypothetical protein [Fictibacillus fluitans]|uniref:ABC transporter permease n=1 Tax=Fictibacillus fluitans TaxID=3058422 RepID=A0ABT8HZS6_9BACL|nr:hypothetical protein [Fictibacillus sp. NE201]MDN4525980.1 hypothetical protein [Fictibacillus sp. NE201]